MANGNVAKPLDVLIADLGFLQEYLEGLAEQFAQEGRQEDAEIAAGWAQLPDEVIERLS